MGVICEFPVLGKFKRRNLSVDEINRFFPYEPLFFQTCAVEYLLKNSFEILKICSFKGQTHVSSEIFLSCAQQYLFELGCYNDAFYFSFKDGSRFRVKGDFTPNLRNSFYHSLDTMNEVNAVSYDIRYNQYIKKLNEEKDDNK